jgi:hypothetical protein
MTRRATSIVLSSAVLLLVPGLAGCGDSNGDGSGGATQASGPHERQIRASVEGLYEDLGNYDAAGVCARMSRAARRQIAQGAIGVRGKAGKGTCEDAFGRFLDLAKKSGGLQKTLTAKVGKIEVDGDEALVTVSFGQQRGQIPLTKVDGEWKMGVSVATPSTAPPAKKK